MNRCQNRKKIVIEWNWRNDKRGKVFVLPLKLNKSLLVFIFVSFHNSLTQFYSEIWMGANWLFRPSKSSKLPKRRLLLHWSITTRPIYIYKLPPPVNRSHFICFWGGFQTRPKSDSISGLDRSGTAGPQIWFYLFIF